MTKKPFVFWLALGIILAVSASPCLGAEEKEAPPVSVRLSGQFVADSDVGDGDGSMSMTSEQLRLQWSLFNISYSQTQFDWENVGSLAFGNGVDDPWERLHRLAVGANYRGKINDDWFYHTGLTLTSTFEKEMAGSYGGVLRGGVGYKLTDEVSLLAGMAVLHNPLRTMFAPSLALSYEDKDDSGAGWSGHLGFPATNLSYHFDMVSAVRVSIESNGQTARLASDSTVAEAGYVDLSGWNSGVYYDWNPSEAVRLSVGPEYHFSRKTTIYNHSGDKLTEEDTDAAWGGALRFRYKF